MGRHALDLTGRRFGMLVALRRANNEENAAGHARWLCQCDCGAMHVTRGTALTAHPNRIHRCTRCARINADPELIGHETVVDIWYYAAGEEGGFAVARSDLGRVLAVTTWSRMPQRLVGDAVGHLLARRCLTRLAEAGHIRDRHAKEGVRAWAKAGNVKVRAHLFTPRDRMQAEWGKAQVTYGDPAPV